MEPLAAEVAVPTVVLFCGIGIQSVQNSSFDVLLTALFGLFGYVCVKLECEPAPLILGFMLGPLREENLRRALPLSRGDPSVFLRRPISLATLVIAAPAVLNEREEGARLE